MLRLQAPDKAEELEVQGKATFKSKVARGYESARSEAYSISD